MKTLILFIFIFFASYILACSVDGRTACVVTHNFDSEATDCADDLTLLYSENAKTDNTSNCYFFNFNHSSDWGVGAATRHGLGNTSIGSYSDNKVSHDSFYWTGINRNQILGVTKYIQLYKNGINPVANKSELRIKLLFNIIKEPDVDYYARCPGMRFLINDPYNYQPITLRHAFYSG